MAETPLPTSAVLTSIAKHIAVNCKSENRAFMECKKENRDPEACLAVGESVTKCTVALLKKLNATAPKELKAYYECMDYYSNNLLRCREYEEAFFKMCPLDS
mmetsp:Transcript_34287/g.61195  ORF Transcript_34287/g.61195 Transcript_34287/m.61195 type:complete len:102 (-) Transcript_34287:90-395(-)|eukprot:CAMPEP_0177764912 /NCGR_PEP_ID=MMETSP0491_2-20121128/7691_1 /TAXON_ID=63592 /ORGANISM="Tetraselmis chuii, Strain PLY429" /LENGTH=101 /DNA_ID=CAMNT_0019281185 /DNA_START=132 /DNA_END=437 /DNA_ORIENTATION=+